MRSLSLWVATPMVTVNVTSSLPVSYTHLDVYKRQVLNAILAGFSETYVMVLGVYYKLQTFIYLSATGIVQGIRPLVGYNYGAGEGKRVRNIYATGLVLTVFLMLSGTTLSWIMPERLFGLFTTNTNTLSLGVEALHIISIGFIVSAISVTTSGALEGIGMGLPSLIISLLRYAIVIMPAAFVLSRDVYKRQI